MESPTGHPGLSLQGSSLPMNVSLLCSPCSPTMRVRHVDMCHSATLELLEIGHLGVLSYPSEVKASLSATDPDLPQGTRWRGWLSASGSKGQHTFSAAGVVLSISHTLTQLTLTASLGRQLSSLPQLYSMKEENLASQPSS